MRSQKRGGNSIGTGGTSTSERIASTEGVSDSRRAIPENPFKTELSIGKGIDTISKRYGQQRIDCWPKNLDFCLL